MSGERMNDESQNRKILCDIARTAFEVVGRLLFNDQLLSKELRSDETTSRQIYREECITTEMAVELRKLFPEHVQITLFTPPEERRTGADWYWRVEKAGGAIHARLQAKRVQRSEFGQDDSDGNVDINREQLKRLIGETQTLSAPLNNLQAWLATYARFNATPPCGKTDLQCCNSHCHFSPCKKICTCVRFPSVWIAQAQEILNLQKQRVRVTKIVEKSLRLDCILPCIDASHADGDKPARAGDGPASKGFILQAGLSPYQDCVDAIQADDQLRKEFEGALLIKF